MAEDTEYKKLPIEERCLHKLWKARVDGYEEAARIFREMDDEKSPEWSKYSSIVKKMVVDSNVVAQEKGLEAALIFVEDYAQAGKTVGDVMAGIVQKCIAAPKAKTKELAVQITLMYIEIEKQEAVMEELVKGMDAKNPKIVAACVAACTLALKEFGAKVVSVKPLIKKLAPLMSDRDKSVRDEGKALAVEIYRWIGVAMKQQISSLPQVTIKELEDEFEKVKNERAEPKRYLRSQQQKQQKEAAALGNDEDVDDDEGEGGGEEIDPMDLIDPVDILSKLPKDFYEKLEEKKWSTRKESLDALETLLNESPKLENGDYGGLVNTLKKTITKDTNVVLVALAGKNLAMLAKGLGKRFSPYAMACMPSLLEKFKEKKANVVTALREAIDAIYPSTNLEAMQECIVEALGNKNPSVKAETASFLARAFARTQPATLNKKLIKLLVTSLIKTLNESDPTVRDNSAESLGTLSKLMGEKVVAPFLTEVDALKMAKIKECQDKAEIVVKVAAPKKDRPATAPAAAAQKAGPAKAKPSASSAAASESKPPLRPATSGLKKPVAKKAASAFSTGNGGGGGGGDAVKSRALATEREMSPEEVQSKSEELLPADVLTGLGDATWKNRLAAVESFMAELPNFDAKTPGLSQTLIRTVSGRKPGLKEMNFQVLKVKLDIIRSVAESYPVTTITVDTVINEITEKLADAKNGGAAADVLTALADATKLEYIVNKVLTFAFEQKSPKVQSESLNWVSKAILEFGFQIQPKTLIEDVRKAVQSTNPTVRGAAIGLIGTMTLYMGNTLMMFFENEKPALKSQIQTEFDKHVGEKPPKPIRGAQAKKSYRAADAADNDDDADADDSPEQANLADILPRVDISLQITESLLREISDKDWKTRNEGLNKLQAIISEAKLIKSTIGDLGPALALRLVDSNAKIAQTTIAICEQLANAMGPGCRQHVRALLPGLLNCLGDNKAFVRAAALGCMNTFGEKGGYKEFFEGEMIADALKTGSPALKTELWSWLAERLPQQPPKSISKEELTAMMPHLYAHISDRNADVRKSANEAVLGIMIHLGYEAMLKASDKQKPAAKKDIQAALDKARPNLPIKPLPKGKQQAPIPEETKKTIRGGGGANAKAVNAKDAAVAKAAGSSRKKEEEVDTSPLLAVNNSKNQRLIDEQKMRVLKWTFTTPREEFVELLRDQMTTANVNKGLMANMFHDDFRYHLKVIEQLSEDLGNNSKALVCNLDLILKWLSLRFYDTNPSVLIKGLDYLIMVFDTLVNMEYVLAENEASAFIPHLLLKLGDPKDPVRNNVRVLLHRILLVYPYAKVFTYLMDALKSKNARQRAECLDELGFLIESYGLSCCQPSQQVALKEIARHISDRDNSVRNAAMNAIVQAYFLAGDKVYKLIGQISEKELSMLDERIKRAKKNRKTTPPTELAAPRLKAGSGTIPTRTNVEQETIDIDDPAEAVEEERDELPPPEEQYEQKPALAMQQSHQFQQFKFSGPFGLDPNVIAEIEKDWVRADQMEVPKLKDVDISILFEPIRVLPGPDGGKYPQDKFEQLLARSRIIKQAHTSPSSNHGTGMNPARGLASPYISPHRFDSSGDASTLNPAEVLPKHDPNIIRMITAMSNPDTITARAAINELTEIIESPDKQAILRDYEEVFMQSVVQALKQLQQMPIAESVVVYKPLLSILYSFFGSKSLGRTMGVACIKNLMSSMLQLMADQKLNNSDDTQYNKVINGVCLKMLDKVNTTHMTCALIRLLRETCSGAALPRFTELVMKCIWRTVKLLPERSNELNYDDVILEVHEFLTALPTAWWQTRPSDTPLRTVKTVVHHMVKLKGNAILQHASRLPKHSELHSFLFKVLKTLQKEGTLPTDSPHRSGSSRDHSNNVDKRISNQVTEKMSGIFKLIADKETKQHGIQSLHEFREQNPDIDISEFLKGANPSFQKFIEDSLAEIDRSTALSGGKKSSSNLRMTTSCLADVNGVNVGGSNVSDGGGNGAVDPEVWMDRLSYWMKRNQNLNSQIQRNFDSTYPMNEANVHLDNRITDENSIGGLNSLNSQKTTSLIQKDGPELSPNRLQHLQAKLAQFKKEANT